jgi:hypothetical protein
MVRSALEFALRPAKAPAGQVALAASLGIAAVIMASPILLKRAATTGLSTLKTSLAIAARMQACRRAAAPSPGRFRPIWHLASAPSRMRRSSLSAPTSLETSMFDMLTWSTLTAPPASTASLFPGEAVQPDTNRAASTIQFIDQYHQAAPENFYEAVCVGATGDAALDAKRFTAASFHCDHGESQVEWSNWELLLVLSR